MGQAELLTAGLLVAVAAAIMRRLGAPRRLVSSIEGEGLFNDATALVAYRVPASRLNTKRLHMKAYPEEEAHGEQGHARQTAS